VSVKTNRSKGFRSDGFSGVEASIITSTTLVTVPCRQMESVGVKKESRDDNHLCELFANHLSDATDVLPQCWSSRLPDWYTVLLHLLEHLCSREGEIS
jgi:hypothetical protein